LAACTLKDPFTGVLFLRHAMVTSLNAPTRNREAYRAFPFLQYSTFIRCAHVVRACRCSHRENGLPMLDQSSDTVTGPRPEISDVFERLAADGKRWAAAELRLARLEADEMKVRSLRVAVAAGTSFAAAFCLLSALTQAGIFFLAPVVGNTGLAALVTAAVLAIVIAICVLVLRRAMAWEAESLLFRWFAQRPEGVP
jgi:uncharacterized membrane protein YqjE